MPHKSAFLSGVQTPEPPNEDLNSDIKPNLNPRVPEDLNDLDQSEFVCLPECIFDLELSPSQLGVLVYLLFSQSREMPHEFASVMTRSEHAHIISAFEKTGIVLVDDLVKILVLRKITAEHVIALHAALIPMEEVAG